MTQTHTPGPWWVYSGANDQVFKDSRTVVAPVSGDYQKWGVTAVAYCDFGTEHYAQANARLIAAAPELLAELKNMAAICSVAAPDHNLALDRAHSAIAKAEGQS